MEKFIGPIDQISLYIQDLPYWPVILLGLAILGGIGANLINRQRRADAVSYYDSIFHEELVDVYPVATRWPDDLSAFMQPRLAILRDAFEVLRNFIPQDQLREYNIAWNRFYQFSRAGGNEQEGISENSAQEPMTKQTQLHQQQQIFHKIVADLVAYTEQFKK